MKWILANLATGCVIGVAVVTIGWVLGESSEWISGAIVGSAMFCPTLFLRRKS